MHFHVNIYENAHTFKVNSLGGNQCSRYFASIQLSYFQHFQISLAEMFCILSTSFKVLWYSINSELQQSGCDVTSAYISFWCFHCPVNFLFFLCCVG